MKTKIIIFVIIAIPLPALYAYYSSAAEVDAELQAKINKLLAGVDPLSVIGYTVSQLQPLFVS
jgi:hypothetical protein